ncbi:uncharacterized protein LOC144618650 [Crassostrea virginica]
MKSNNKQLTNDEENPERHKLLLDNDRDGSNNRQQTYDEENPGAHQLLSHIDKENYRDGSNNRQQTYDEENPGAHQLLSHIDKENYRDEIEAEKDIFEQWENVDDAFVETKATEKVKQMLKTKNLVIVTGFSGSGKSAIIQHIALDYRRKGWVIRPVDAIEEIKDAYYSKNFEETKTLFVFNDPIGKEVFDDILYCSWKKYENTLKVFLKKVKLIMTCRKQILYDTRTKGLFDVKENIVDIDDDHHKLNHDEKMQIFKKYMPGDTFSKNQIENILRIETYFPLLCKLSSEMKDKSMDNIKHVFTSPEQIVSNEIKEYRENDTKKYCALVCLFLFKNHISLSELQKEENLHLFNRCLTLCGTPNVTPPEIIRSLKTLEGFFVKHINYAYGFYHDFIMEVTTYVLGNDYPLVTIQEADLSFLRKRIRIENDENNDFLIISLGELYIDELVNRFFDGLFSNRFMEVVLNPCLRNEKVTRGLIAKMKNNYNVSRQIVEIKIGDIDFETEERKRGLSKIDLLRLTEYWSPLFALIALGYDNLAKFCITNLKNMKTDLAGNRLLCAVCCNGSEDLFNEIQNVDSNIYLYDNKKELSPIHIASAFSRDSLLE